LAGIVSSYGLSLITLITFGFAMIAVPISGANAPDGGIAYPYLETIQQYPRDYIWQYLAMVLMCVYLVNFIIIKELVNDTVKLFAKIGVAFALISTAILLVDYYVQVNSVVISLMSQEFEGIPLLTQYNPHGVFIALEELGYLTMVLSFTCLVPVFWRKGYKPIAIIYLIGLVASVIGYIFISIQFGLDKQDRFEIIIISFAWLILIVNGILIGNKLRKALRAK
jgi:hypothetical protein